jgi:hypothetical protein
MYRVVCGCGRQLVQGRLWFHIFVFSYVFVVSAAINQNAFGRRGGVRQKLQDEADKSNVPKAVTAAFVYLGTRIDKHSLTLIISIACSAIQAGY